MKYLVNGIRGFFMALADSVPGVSGGTIAFVLGFYDKFINSLNDLIYGKKDEKLSALKFLIKLGIGWIIGMVCAVLVLSNLFQSHIYEVSSVFIGFIIFSLPLIMKEEKETLKKNYKNLIFFVFGIVLVALITYFNPVGGAASAINITEFNLGIYLYIFAAAMVAISAMVLPGISGSTILLIFGVYIPIINAIKEFLHMNFSYLPILIVFGLGVIAGILLVIRLIKIALEKHRGAAIYAILGLMVGSLYAIVMGPTTLDVPLSPISFETFHILYFLLGALIMIGLEQLKKVLAKKES